MTDVLILVGKSKNTLGLTATATALQRSLQKQGFSVVSEPQRGNMQEAAAEALMCKTVLIAPRAFVLRGAILKVACLIEPFEGYR